MKKKTLHPIMIALLALFVLLQAFCLTAFGAETVGVYIPAGTETETVNQILTETLLPDSEDTLEWEYECVGKEDGGLLKNTAWGSVGGFESTTKKYFVTHTYIHPALADNADGEYQVRTGEKKFKIRKAAKHTVDFELRRDQEIPLIYDEDGTFNAEDTKEEIGGAAVADQSSVSVLYSGFTSKWKVYSNTTTPPTEPGRYTMTVVVLGGNYLASPINRSFQITK